MDVGNVRNNYYTDSVVPDKAHAKPSTKSATPKVDQMEVYKQEVKKEGQIAQILSKKEMEGAVEELNTKMSRISSDLRFGFNDTADMMEVTVINVQTDKVIRRFPTEDAVKLMASMREFVGLLFDEKG